MLTLINWYNTSVYTTACNILHVRRTAAVVHEASSAVNIVWLYLKVRSKGARIYMSPQALVLVVVAVMVVFVSSAVFVSVLGGVVY